MGFEEYEVSATDRFAADLDVSVAYYLEQAGPHSANRLLDDYDSFCHLVSGMPGHGSPIEGTALRWRKLGVFVVVYEVNDKARRVTLLRLYHISSDWRSRAIRLRQL